MSKIEDGGASGPGSVSSSKNKEPSAEDGDAEREGKRRAGSGGQHAGADEAAERISNVTLDSSPFGEKTRPDPGKAKHAGPSLLSQQAPGVGARPPDVTPTQPPPYSANADDPMSAADTPLSSSAMSVDGAGSVYEAQEKITVKIADLGNGACPPPCPPRRARR